MSEESLRDIALELLESVESLAVDLIYEYSVNPDESMRKLSGDIAEYKRRIDSAK
jgi:hypothetical protein